MLTRLDIDFYMQSLLDVVFAQKANIFNTFGGFFKAGQKNFILHSLFGAPALYLKHVRRLKRFTARLFIVVIGVRCNFAQLAIVPGL